MASANTTEGWSATLPLPKPSPSPSPSSSPSPATRPTTTTTTTSSTLPPLTWGPVPLRPRLPTDIDIRITHAGICGTDLHALRRGGFNPRLPPHPLVVGHEIVGIAVRVGPDASPPVPVQVGDRVGVGAQAGCCGRCEECADGGEVSYCDGFVPTYGGVVKKKDGGEGAEGSRTQGGFARHARVDGRFVVRIPDGLESPHAAPLLCAGVTVWSPLVHFGSSLQPARAEDWRLDYSKVLDGKRIGVVGIGGLGHVAVLFARAMGAAQITGIARREAKRADAIALGCDSYIATSDAKTWVRDHRNSLDLIISTVSSSSVPMKSYLRLLRRDGTLVQLGDPDDGDLKVPTGVLIGKRLRLAGSCVGSPRELVEMLRFAAEKGVVPWVEERGMREANEALRDLENGKARYRYVLVNEERVGRL